jgi:hypothetical protein
MTPVQLIEEEVNEQIHHLPAIGDDYGSLIAKSLRKHGRAILPPLVECLKNYDPKSESRSNQMRFHVCAAELNDFDRGEERLRGTNDGKLAIEALDTAIERMEKAGFDKGEFNSPLNFSFAVLYQKSQKGITSCDEMIRNTLQIKHKVEMSDEEALSFSNYLVSIDPRYPTWSDVGEYGPPMQVADSKKFYDAYLAYKKGK